MAQQFLEGEIQDIEEINSLRYVRELFYQMRIFYRKLQNNARYMASRQGESNKEDTQEGEEGQAELTKQQTMMEEDGVG